MDEPLVVVTDLAKKFGRTDAVAGVSFELTPGRILGLLGPNGAGKSTTLKMLLGLVRPSSGSALIAGRPYAQLTKPATVGGAALENTAFAPGRSGRDHLRMLAPFVGAEDRAVDEALERVGIAKDGRRPVREYSLGMRQRLALATAMLGRPRLLVLDEPGNGLDPIGITWLRQTLSALAESGVAVLVSSHLLVELDRVVQDVVLLDRSAQLFAGTRDELVGGNAVVAIAAGERAEAMRDLLARQFALHPLPDGRLWVENPAPEVEDLLRRHSVDRGEVRVEPADLESAFMNRTETTEAIAQ